MSLPSTSLPARVLASVEHGACRALLRRFADVPVEFELPGGRRVVVSRGPLRDRVRMRTHRSVVAVLCADSLRLGDLYCDGELEVEGDLARVLAGINRSLSPGPRGRDRLRAAVARIGRTLRRRDAGTHYERGAEFFSAWLDAGLTYTCAYFPRPDASLDEAQKAKMELVCRKLRLAAGERVVEAGSGWGGMALHMASRFGVRVRAFNTSLSQVEYAREQARRRRLEGEVEFVHGDYREIRETADAFVSIGMLEHVGPGNYREFGALVARTVGSGGRALLHTIGRASPMPTDAWIDRRVFPGGAAPSLAEISRIHEPNGLVVVHLENLRHHYARTLAHWLERYERALASGVLAIDEREARTWRLYLASSQAAFETGWAQLFQLLLVPTSCVSFEPPSSLLGDRWCAEASPHAAVAESDP